MAECLKLSDFADGIVVGVQFPKLRNDKAAIAQVRQWLADGKLSSPVADPDPVCDLLFAVVAKPAEVASPPVQGREVKGVAWMASAQQFTDGLLLPAGCRVTETPERQWKEFEQTPGMVRDCVYRLTKETGRKPFVTAVDGRLRVLSREFITDTKPTIEVKPTKRKKVGA